MGITRVAVACGILLLAGCVGQPVVASYPPVPAARVEVVPPPPPEREQVHWQPGRYVVRVVGATRWVEGHWVARPRGYVWVAGHWG